MIGRMEERLGLLRREVERRGYKWDQDEERPVVQNGDAMDVDGVDVAGGGAARVNGVQDVTADTPTATTTNATRSSTARIDPADADMLALLHARLRGNDDQEGSEQGLHL